MHTTLSWLDFVDYFEKEEGGGVLVQILKKTSLVEVSEGVASISCDNLGIKLLLDNKKKEIDQVLSSWSGETIETTFLIREKKPQKKTTSLPETPLLQFEVEKNHIAKKSGLQSKYTFENFAVSSSNQIAYSAAKKVAENPGVLYNPLFIYGTVGVGKTHLTQAVANFILDKNINKKVFYCSSEEFTNDLIESIRNKNTAEFRKKYRHLDILLIDDVQFIAGKQYVQEEFYHTFNTIIKNGGQIIITSEKPPREIKKLEDRLQSRFSGGLTIDIQKPDFELRAAIILIKAAQRNIQININTAKIIAEYTDDTRELEGKLLEVYSRTINNNNEMSIDQIKDVLTKKRQESTSKINPADVVKTICLYYNVKQSLIKSPSRKEIITLPRQIAMYILRTVLKLKLEDISLILKRKDHTTVIHGVDKITALSIKDPQIKTDIDMIIKSLYN